MKGKARKRSEMQSKIEDKGIPVKRSDSDIE
jgi:hypothetical protein